MGFCKFSWLIGAQQAISGIKFRNANSFCLIIENSIKIDLTLTLLMDFGQQILNIKHRVQLLASDYLSR